MIKKIIFLLLFSFSLNLALPSSVQAQTCTAPVAASGVTVEYPGCNGSSCDLVQASCSWGSQADAASFNVTVTEVETSTIIKNNESQTSSTTKILFPITQGRTYKCDVVSVSACGGLASASSDQLLCEADAIIDTPTPSPIPPTAAPDIPTATPTIASPGGLVPAVGIIGGAILVLAFGFVLFFL